jgi:hypothetical protein
VAAQSAVFRFALVWSWNRLENDDHEQASSPVPVKAMFNTGGVTITCVSQADGNLLARKTREENTFDTGQASA